MSTLFPIHLLWGRMEPARNVTQGDVALAQSVARHYLAHDPGRQLDRWRSEALGLFECTLAASVAVVMDGSARLVILVLVVDLLLSWLTDLVKLAAAREHSRTALDTLFELGETRRLARRLARRRPEERVLRHRFWRKVPDPRWNMFLGIFGMGIYLGITLMAVLIGPGESLWTWENAWIAGVPLLIRGTALGLGLLRMSRVEAAEGRLEWAPSTYALLLMNVVCLMSIIPVYAGLEGWLGKDALSDHLGTVVLGLVGAYALIAASVGAWRARRGIAHLRWLARTPFEVLWPQR